MSTLTGLLYTARDALTAQSFGLSVTGQNVANANTPLYARREAMLQTRPLGNSGTVEVKGMSQAIDGFADRRLYESASLSSAADERDGQLAKVEAVFNELAGSGLGDSLSALFGAFDTLSTRPDDPTARIAVLDRADAFASRTRDVGDQLASARNELLNQAQSIVKEINGKAVEVAKLSRQISIASSTGQEVADLVDRRNLTLLDMAEYVDIRTVTSGDGSLLVQASGTTLVEGGEYRQFDVELNPDGSIKLLAERPDGGGSTEVTNYLTGGKLAAVKEVRDQDIFEVERRFDEFVFDVATAINTQHALGMGLDGVGARNIFDVSPTSDGAARALSLSGDVAGNPDAVAATLNAADLPGGSDNAVAMAQILSQRVVFGNSRTISEGYADIVGDVGVRKSSASSDVSFRQAIFDQAQSFRESASGVSLDEEMVALTKYQRAYQAASKVLTTVDELLGELMARVG